MRGGPVSGAGELLGPRLARLQTDRRRHLVAVILLALCAVLLWTSERGRSLTMDEPLHLVRGHAYWWLGTAQLSYAHPPLANAITSLPYAGQGESPWGPHRLADGSLANPERAEAEVDDVEPPLTGATALRSLSGWKEVNPLPLSTGYFRHDLQRAKTELTGGRRVMMVWTLMLALGLYLWVEHRYGWVSAIFALALFSLHPTLLAHGRLLTTDMPLTAMTLASLAATIAWIERPSWGRVGLFWLATTTMVLTKHSGLMFTVVLSLMVVGAAALGRSGFATRPLRWRSTLLVLAQLTIVAAAMVLCIDAAYRFDRVGLTVAEVLAEPEPHNWISNRHDFELLERSVIAKLPPSWRLPFPYTWLVGVATVSEQSARGHGNYFFGLRGHSGNPLYFPVMLFAKSPTGLLVLLGLGAHIVLGRVRQRQWPSMTTTVLLVFSGICLAIACASDINIGVRHVLPLMLISVVLAARTAELLLAGAVQRLGVRGAQVLTLGCLLGCAIGAAWTFPGWLGDFNLLVGGPVGGHKISVIGEDWGQDVDDVGRLAVEQDWKRVVYYTKVPLHVDELEAFGIEVERIRCDEMALGPDPLVIHVSDWLRHPSCFEPIRDRAPTYIVNHHILVFVD